MAELKNEGGVRQIILTQDEDRALHDAGISGDGLAFIDAKNIHDSVLLSCAYFDAVNECLVFFHDLPRNYSSFQDQKRMIYYMGLENDAELVTRFGGVTVWSGCAAADRFADTDDDGELVLYDLVEGFETPE